MLHHVLTLCLLTKHVILYHFRGGGTLGRDNVDAEHVRYLLLKSEGGRSSTLFLLFTS